MYFDFNYIIITFAAVKNNHIDIVETLIESTDVNIQDNGDLTALMWGIVKIFVYLI